MQRENITIQVVVGFPALLHQLTPQWVASSNRSLNVSLLCRETPSIKESTELVPPVGSEGNSVPCLSLSALSFWRVSSILSVLWLVDACLQSLPPSPPGLLPVNLCFRHLLLLLLML